MLDSNLLTRPTMITMVHNVSSTNTNRNALISWMVYQHARKTSRPIANIIRWGGRYEQYTATNRTKW